MATRLLLADLRLSSGSAPFVTDSRVIAGGDEVPAFRRPTVPGNQGENPEDAEMEDVQIYVPSDSVIDPNETEDPTIGTGTQIRKRG